MLDGLDHVGGRAGQAGVGVLAEPSEHVVQVHARRDVCEPLLDTWGLLLPRRATESVAVLDEVTVTAAGGPVEAGEMIEMPVGAKALILIKFVKNVLEPVGVGGEGESYEFDGVLERAPGVGLRLGVAARLEEHEHRPCLPVDGVPPRGGDQTGSVPVVRIGMGPPVPGVRSAGAGRRRASRG